MCKDRQELDFRILYQTILEIIEELSIKNRIPKEELASFGVYKKIGNSVRKFNLYKHIWNEDQNKVPALFSSN